MAIVRRLFIFNAETDFALATDTRTYTPPASVIALKHRMALLPAVFANPKDLILVPEDFCIAADVEYWATARAKEIEVLKPSQLQPLIYDDLEIVPWGWNRSLCYELERAGVQTRLLKTDSEIDGIRRLSHRRTAIQFQEMLLGTGRFDFEKAREFDNVEDAMHFACTQTDPYFKLPWSSSGRGVLRVTETGLRKTEEWLRGGIRKQGSVTAEVGLDRAADFATEWFVDTSGVHYLGLSMFDTNPEGRYLGNIYATQDEIINRIQSFCPDWDGNVIEAQSHAIQNLIAPDYSGPLGIDMIIDKNGKLMPCVEINLRHTMGMLNLIDKIYRQ